MWAERVGQPNPIPIICGVPVAWQQPPVTCLVPVFSLAQQCCRLLSLLIQHSSRWLESPFYFCQQHMSRVYIQAFFVAMQNAVAMRSSCVNVVAFLCCFCREIAVNDAMLATKLRRDLVNVHFHKCENICALGWKECQTKGLCQTDGVILGQGNNGWQSQQDRLFLHFDNNSMCCVISCTSSASCCPCIAVMSTTSVKLMWCFFCWFFFLLTWPLNHLCLFFL